MNELALLTSADSKGKKLYVDDVFSAYTYTGNGATQAINNGIDLAGKGGLVWTKSRSSATTHRLFDTTGRSGILSTDTSNAQNEIGAYPTNVYGLSNGYMTNRSVASMNEASVTYVSWTFRKAPKFFDVVTYTGNGVARTISHNLDQVPGMIVVKRTDAVGDWFVYHRASDAVSHQDYHLLLNTTAAKIAPSVWQGTAPTSTVFTVNTTGVNESGATYVAYLFAHDTSADGIVQCGSYNGDGNPQQIINLGWETQYTIIKKTNSTGDWWINDVSRGFPVNGYSGGEPTLQANLSNAESNQIIGEPNASGFIVNNNNTNQSGGTYIYIAIRRSNKPPKLGTEVYNAIARAGTGAAATVTGVGFAPDLALIGARTTNRAKMIQDRLRGNSVSLTIDSNVEQSTAINVTSFDMDGVSLGTGTNTNANNLSDIYINYLFKRAAGVFDQVCYTGDGTLTNGRNIYHNLKSYPELIIIKSRGQSTNWQVVTPFGIANLNLAAGPQDYSGGYPTFRSDTSFGFQANNNTDVSAVNASGVNYVAYLFASYKGISRTAMYSGNGSSQTIDCEFTTGARFILIKDMAANNTGDWYVWDTVRGIVAANDPHLSLNTTAAEVTTDDSIDPIVSGFIVNQNTSTNINANGGQYIYLAFA